MFGIKFPEPYKVLPILMKRFVEQLLLALNYAHTSGAIHTGTLDQHNTIVNSLTRRVLDIPPANIMLQINDQSIVEDFYLPDTEHSEDDST